MRRAVCPCVRWLALSLLAYLKLSKLELSVTFSWTYYLSLPSILYDTYVQHLSGHSSRFTPILCFVISSTYRRWQHTLILHSLTDLDLPLPCTASYVTMRQARFAMKSRSEQSMHCCGYSSLLIEKKA